MALCCLPASLEQERGPLFFHPPKDLPTSVFARLPDEFRKADPNNDWARYQPHEPFAMLRIWMVDGETVRQELYPRGCGSLGLIGCGHCRCLVEVWNCAHVDISSGTRVAKRARFGNAQAIVRCGEPV